MKSKIRKSVAEVDILSVRVPKKTMERFRTICAERELNPSDATRQLISYWLFNPDALRIGLPTEADK